ncbi:hypothetical protein M409DRAFT_25709 [Zasmidium cellare ATCC 36951]|uniref:RING-type domain-containing protein n=1 Tax=Zasmidium cellare ATCC 36951 TaxID=1080233 RepID=A0A6A6CDD2_ZASCE|nr:uncharacterized protein M409DRAFT_25709 [Zasmidium cellare ATCC 36951]KAF2163932.1 hypothetical protein M409DRAFT_25709 [Zasmidium cellare ATCC 36951]
MANPNPAPRTRADFFFTGCGWNQIDSTTTCPICYDTTKCPVQLACHESHIFCLACMLTWFQQPGINTCPICRAALFALEDEDEDEESLLDFPQLMDRVRHLTEQRDFDGALDFLVDQVERERVELMEPMRASPRIDDDRLGLDWHHVLETEEQVAVETAWMDAEEVVAGRYRRYSDSELLRVTEEVVDVAGEVVLRFSWGGGAREI